jgi:hypothetical protein
MPKYTTQEKINYVNKFLNQYQQGGRITCTSFCNEVFGEKGNYCFVKWLRKYDTNHIYPFIKRPNRRKEHNKEPLAASKAGIGGEIVAIGNIFSQIATPPPVENTPILINIPGMTITLDAQADVNQIKRVIRAIKEIN